MRRSLPTRVCLTLTLLWLTARQLPPAASAADPEPTPSEDFYAGSPEEFRARAAAGQEIDPANLREDLLSAAIFHETNRRRADLKLPALGFDARVRAAALGHARVMAEHKTLSHDTPWQPQNTTPADRLAAQGLRPRFVAENIAFNFVLRYESGKPFYTRHENGQTVRSYEPGGPALPRHTYNSFAGAILTQWMNSPHHRENIVAPESEFLGVGSALAPDEKGFDTIYAVQNFFAPLPDLAPATPATTPTP